jgi:hypothetical protein
MPTTTKVSPDRLEKYFDTFSKHFLMHESTNAVDVEVLTPELGDQYEVEGAHLAGITYDPRAKAIEIEFEGGDHRVYKPSEVWVVEEADGFVNAIEMVQPDGTREVVRIKRLGVRRRE